MSSAKRWKFKKLFNCGCRPTATDAVVEPNIKPKPKPKPSLFSDEKLGYCASSSVSSGERHDGYTSTTFSPNTGNSPLLCPEFSDSLAVAKDSDDPYRDFRQSMLEMIAEKEIYSRSDLQQLLRCFLDLNPPRHHETIVRAFMDIWNGGVAEGIDMMEARGERRLVPPRCVRTCLVNAIRCMLLLLFC